MQENYLDVLAKNILNDVKRMLEHNRIILNENKIIETDQKMLEIIKSVVKNEKDILFEKDEEETTKRKEIDSNIMPSLMQYYVAINNENLDLLHKLLDNNFEWGNYKYKEMKLFVLDKNFFSLFDEYEYINILKNYMEIFERFYFGLYYVSNKNKELNKDKIIEKFCNIIKIYNKNNKKDEYSNLFTIDFLNNFTEEEILNLTEEQKYNLRDFEIKNDKTSQLILDLIKKHNFSKKIIYWNNFSKYFNEEEILNLTQEDIDLFENIYFHNDRYDNSKELEKNAVYKLKQIKKENKDFNIRLDIMIYNVLTTKQILSMSESCADKLNTICYNFGFHKSFDYNFNVSENTLKKWIKERYHMENIKKILVKKK